MRPGSCPACACWRRASSGCWPGWRLPWWQATKVTGLQRLQEEGVVELDEERKASMVSNLLVVLCSEQATQPVVNTGTLYQ